ncbi:hypothetical protein VFPPC_06896 [Pochonia chlamydosporia 170]|uniref:Uncharacterized protein n=1 Tax=Pochonia chlamydosporia 170 TaxID=1380566 RepID=A0A179FAZ4_METCM|nr:hypothetical protein VFPPC_06896 [Pochonia chlamydosporia 170]OAQ62480.1 hypothetical protein VFPPC_06896 [Pochonia chlamydosporia 170]
MASHRTTRLVWSCIALLLVFSQVLLAAPKFKPEVTPDPNGLEVRLDYALYTGEKRRILFSSHLTFGEGLRITDKQLRSLGIEAYKEMEAMGRAYELGKNAMPNVMTILTFGNEIILASSQKGKDKPDIGEEITEELNACFAGFGKDHANQRKCGEVMAIDQYYKSRAGAPKLDIRARIAAIVANKDATSANPYIILAPCGTNDPERPGCNLLVKDLNVLSDGKISEDTDTTELDWRSLKRGGQLRIRQMPDPGEDELKNAEDRQKKGEEELRKEKEELQKEREERPPRLEQEKAVQQTEQQNTALEVVGALISVGAAVGGAAGLTALVAAAAGGTEAAGGAAALTAAGAVALTAAEIADEAIPLLMDSLEVYDGALEALPETVELPELAPALRRRAVTDPSIQKKRNAHTEGREKAEKKAIALRPVMLQAVNAGVTTGLEVAQRNMSVATGSKRRALSDTDVKNLTAWAGRIYKGVQNQTSTVVLGVATNLTVSLVVTELMRNNGTALSAKDVAERGLQDFLNGVTDELHGKSNEIVRRVGYKYCFEYPGNQRCFSDWSFRTDIVPRDRFLYGGCRSFPREFWPRQTETGCLIVSGGENLQNMSDARYAVLRITSLRDDFATMTREYCEYSIQYLLNICNTGGILPTSSSDNGTFAWAWSIEPNNGQCPCRENNNSGAYHLPPFRIGYDGIVERGNWRGKQWRMQFGG